MHLRFNNPNYAPPESETGGTPDLGKEEIIELLGEEENEEVLELEEGAKKSPSTDTDTGREEGTEEGKEEEEVDELKELEEELKEPKEEDLEELMTPVRRREILKKYPTLFKDFPYLEKAYYREQQFTEIHPTIADARQSANKARVLDNIERDVMSGNISNVLLAAKQEDQEAFNKIADNYLPALKKADEQAYYHVLGNVVKDTIITMVREANSLGEQGAPLKAAANILNQFVFGSQQFQPPTPLSRKSDPRQQQQEQEFRQQQQRQVMGQFESVKDDLQERADNVLRSTIDQHIDPRKTMTDYVKTHATREAFESLEGLISKDARFRGLLDKLWEKAFERNFDKESTDKIKSAYLSKAKTLLPSVIKKARNDALKGLGKRAETEEAEEPLAVKSPTTRSGSPQALSSGKIRKPSDIPRGMSTLDVLMKD